MKTNYASSVWLQNRRKFTTFFILLVMTYSLYSQVNYTFTPCGALGATGPTQLQVNNTYTLGNSLNGSVTISGQGIQQFTVPVTGNYRIEARGARGYNPSGFGGRGAIVSGDFNLTVGTVLKIAVGQEGQVNPAAGTLQFGGGGGSFVSLLNNTPLIVAGGGGGSHATSYVASTADGTVTNNGNSGMGTAAGAGGVAGGGGAASSLANGGAGFYGDGGGTTGPAISFTNGALGGNVGAIPYANGAIGGFGGGGGTQSWNNNRGGGGGGYSGGGGGQLGQPACWGGGGGSYNNGTNQTNLSGANASDGLVLITRLCNITLGTNTGSNLLCQGAAVTLTTDAISSYTWSNGSNASAITVSPNVTTTYTLTAMSPSLCITNAAITITVSTGPPALTITPTSNSVCLGNTVSILASGALTYTFSGGISNGVPFAPVATTAYTVLGQNGCGISSSVTIITISPLAVLGIVSPAIVCASTTATLSGGGATSYTWEPGGLVGANVIVSPTNNTTYTVTGGTGNCIGINTVALATNPNPTISTTSSSLMICQGESVTLTATGALNYTWQPGGLTGGTVVVTPSIPTPYVVTGVNSFNCSSSISQPVIVFANPTVNVGSSNTLICVGASALLTASGANTYAWNNGPTTQTQVVSPVITTAYTVVGTNTTTQCSDTKTIQVSVFSATIAVSNPTGVCIGNSVMLNASGATSYNWSNGGTGSSIVVSPVTSTGYTVNGVSAIGNSTCASSGTTSLVVNPLPVIVAGTTRTFICRNEKAVITASGGATYLWNNLSTAPTITVTPLSTTGYTVTGTDINGCISVGSITINVSACVGIEDLSNKLLQISIYPNPSDGEFNLKADEGMELTLINELGQKIKTMRLDESNNYATKVKDVANGIYFIVGEGETYRVYQKLIIQK